MNLDKRFHDAIEKFWLARQQQLQKQVEGGRIDAGVRGAVTGGGQMRAIEALVTDLLLDAGLEQVHIRTGVFLELPGYYRPEKKWDLVVVAEGALVAAIEFKSQVGPSFGNNFNNRSEEAIGSASDIWVAHREGLFGTAPVPFLGYFFLLEDCPRTRSPVRTKEPFFATDPVFNSSSYALRYEVLCRRLVLERLYTAACLTLATPGPGSQISHPAEDVSFRRFAAALRGHAVTWLGSRG